MSQNNWPYCPNMMLTTSAWGPSESFSLVPVTKDCPYIEVLYNPAAKTLAIIGKSKKDTFHMIPRLDDNGKSQMLKGTQEQKKQRVQQESYSEYYITERSEIETFLNNFAVNAKDFDYAKFLDMKGMEDPSAVAKGPQLILEK